MSHRGECQRETLGVGSYAAAGSSSCEACAAGRVDSDTNPATACAHCVSGMFSGCGEVQCVACTAGKIDGDLSPATPCTACLPGQYWLPGAGVSDPHSKCLLCEAGKADTDAYR